MAIQQIQPEELFQRKLGGQPLYSAVVVATGKKMIFVAGTVSRNRKGEIVGVGDMRAQILQVAENLRISLRAAGASFKDLVRTTTYVTAIDEFFKHPDARAVIFGEFLSNQYDRRGEAPVAAGANGRDRGCRDGGRIGSVEGSWGACP